MKEKLTKNVSEVSADMDKKRAFQSTNSAFLKMRFDELKK